MERVITKDILGLLLCCLTFTACEEEIIYQLNPSGVADGEFVIDYAAEAGLGTKAIHENVEKGVRINSLTYLLYNNDGSLEKRREIPGLDGDKDVWPLTRDNMSWEQREALKDTLATNTNYHVVFVANLDKWKAADGTTPLKEESDYNKVYLELPSSPFDDGNMFYLFTTDVNSIAQNADRDKPYNCPVLLQRIVTRQDFWGERLPEWKEPTADGEKNPAEEYVHNHSLKLLISLCFNNDNSAIIGNNLKRGMEDFWGDIKKQFDGLARTGGVLIPENQKNSAKCDSLAKAVATGRHYMTHLQDENVFTDLDTKLLGECKSNNKLKEIFTVQRWEGKGVSVKHKDKENQTTNISTTANKFYLSNWRTDSDGASSVVKYSVDTVRTDKINETTSITYDGFTWIGFGSNQGENAEKANLIESLIFYTKDADGTTDVESFRVGAADCTTSQSTNLRASSTYTPITSLGYNADSKSEQEYTFTCNMEELFFAPADKQTEEDKKFIEAVNKQIPKVLTGGLIGDKKYGDNLKAITIKVMIPNLYNKDESALIINSEWKTK